MIDYLVFPVRFVIWLIAVTVWAVVGFLVWIPFLLRLMGNYLVTMLSSALRNTHLENAEAALHHGIRFYIDGFHKTSSILRSNRPPDKLFAARGPRLSQLIRFGFEIAYTAVFWVAVGMAVGGIPVRASGVCFPGTSLCVTRESADADLVGVWRSDGNSPMDWVGLSFNRSGVISVETPPRGGRRAFRFGDFYTNHDRLLIFFSAPSPEVLTLSYRVTSGRLVVWDSRGSAGTFRPIRSTKENSRIVDFLRLDVLDRGRRMWGWLQTQVRAFLSQL